MKFNTNRSLSNYKLNIDAEINLVCFANAGSGPAIFRQWDKKIERKVNVWGASYPGRDALSSFEPALSIDELVSYYTKDLSPFVDGKFILYGHSFGALVAYELAVRLQGLGRIAAALCIGARRAPHMVSRGNELAEDLRNGSISDDALVDELKNHGGIPDALLDNAELLNYYLPHIRNDLVLNNSVERDEGEKLLSPIFGFYSSSDSIVYPQEVFGWASCTAEQFEPIQVSGGHFFLKDDNNKFFYELSRIIENTSN